MNHGFSEPEVRAESAPIEEYVESTNQIDSELSEVTEQKRHYRSSSVEAIFAEQSELLKFLINGSFCALIFFGGLLLLIAGIFSYRHRKKNLWGKSIYLVQKCFFSKFFDYWLFYKDT